MEILFDFLTSVIYGLGIATLIWYFIIRPILNLPYKQWDRKMKNPPPPPKKDAYMGAYEIRDGKFYRVKNPPKETGT